MAHNRLWKISSMAYGSLWTDMNMLPPLLLLWYDFLWTDMLKLLPLLLIWPTKLCRQPFLCYFPNGFYGIKYLLYSLVSMAYFTSLWHITVGGLLCLCFFPHFFYGTNQLLSFPYFFYGTQQFVDSHGCATSLTSSMAPDSLWTDKCILLTLLLPRPMKFCAQLYTSLLLLL